mmetsp:Transcript_37797/g.118387  ORF Transcript_37797/g.118387 Transcript_37797/m.118387 type:complete len:364 (-) Transcript_37797:64-1155(-)
MAQAGGGSAMAVHRLLFSNSDHFTDEQDMALLGVSVGFAVPSFILSSIVLTSYACHTNLRTRSFLLVAQLAWADIGADISYFFGDPADGTAACTLQGILQQFFQLASFMWASIIATTLYLKLVKRQFDMEFWKLAAVGWGVPGFLTILPATTDSYGQTGGWCWIKTTDKEEGDVGTVWRFVTFYLVLWVCIIVDVYLMVEVARYVRRIVDLSGGNLGESTKKVLATVERLKYYPCILIVCWVPGTINRIHNTIHPTDPVFALAIIQVLFRSWQGILNALAYGLNSTVRATWWRSIKVHYPKVYAFALRVNLVGDEESILRNANQDEDDDGETTAGMEMGGTGSSNADSAASAEPLSSDKLSSV